MATYIEPSIFIDPAVALAPFRYGLPPHPEELRRRDDLMAEVRRLGQGCEIIIITHYHYDHHNRNYPELYKDKVVLIKDPNNNINPSQQYRAQLFLDFIKPLARKIEIADGKSFQFGSMKIVFSPPVLHGATNHSGYVIEVMVSNEDTSFLFTSDVQGPPLVEQTRFIIEQNPKLVYCDGPTTYMLGTNYRISDLFHAIENINKIIAETQVTEIILDHHLTRDLDFRTHLEPVFKRKSKTAVLTAAEYLGEKNSFLEANRKRLYCE